jgi:hypothetical protein
LAVFAGSGNPGYADSNGIFTTFKSPPALAADAANNIYVWASGNDLLAKTGAGCSDYGDECARQNPPRPVHGWLGGLLKAGEVG